MAHEACRKGYTALFVNTYRMLQHINGGRADGTLERRFQTYRRPDLLVLDDFGLKPLRPPAPEDLYDVVNERYERGTYRVYCILMHIYRQSVFRLEFFRRHVGEWPHMAENRWPHAGRKLTTP